mgnify:CR=1 FL=1
MSTPTIDLLLRARDQMTPTLSRAGSGVGAFVTKVRSLYLAVAGFVGAATTAMVKLSQAGSRIVDLAAAMNVGTDEAQGLIYSLQQTGTGAERAGVLIRSVSQFLVSARSNGAGTASTLSDLGLTLSDLEGQTPTEAFYTLADGLRNISDESKRSVTAMQVFGARTGGAALALVNSTEAAGELVDRLQALGGVFSSSQLNALDAFGDTWADFKIQVQHLLADALIPAMPVVEQFGAALLETGRAVLPTLIPALSAALDLLVALLPVVTSLAPAIEGVASLISTVVTLLSPVLSYLLPTLIEGIGKGLELLIAVGDWAGLGELEKLAGDVGTLRREVELSVEDFSSLETELEGIEDTGAREAIRALIDQVVAGEIPLSEAKQAISTYGGEIETLGNHALTTASNLLELRTRFYDWIDAASAAPVVEDSFSALEDAIHRMNTALREMPSGPQSAADLLRLTNETAADTQLILSELTRGTTEFQAAAADATATPLPALLTRESLLIAEGEARAAEDTAGAVSEIEEDSGEVSGNVERTAANLKELWSFLNALDPEAAKAALLSLPEEDRQAYLDYMSTVRERLAEERERIIQAREEASAALDRIMEKRRAFTEEEVALAQRAYEKRAAAYQAEIAWIGRAVSRAQDFGEGWLKAATEGGDAAEQFADQWIAEIERIIASYAVSAFLNLITGGIGGSIFGKLAGSIGGTKFGRKFQGGGTVLHAQGGITVPDEGQYGDRFLAVLGRGEKVSRRSEAKSQEAERLFQWMTGRGGAGRTIIIQANNPLLTESELSRIRRVVSEAQA